VLTTLLGPVTPRQHAAHVPLHTQQRSKQRAPAGSNAWGNTSSPLCEPWSIATKVLLPALLQLQPVVRQRTLLFRRPYSLANDAAQSLACSSTSPLPLAVLQNRRDAYGSSSW